MHSLLVLTICLLYQLPVVSDLRNPSLKQRHWDAIERVVDYTFTEEEPFTLGLLLHIGAFSHSEQIQEISAQASSEASLEGILKKVLFWHSNIQSLFYFLCTFIFVGLS